MKRDICLAMIVKNEAHVIRRALDSAKPYITHVYICDTGSTDGTQVVIEQWLDENGIDGCVHQSQWVDFATNRSQLCALAEDFMDDYERPDREQYLLFLDADAALSGSLPDDPAMVGDVIMCKQRLANAAGEFCEYYRPTIVNISDCGGWQYKGIVHEYLDIPEWAVVTRSDALVTTHLQDGARSRDPEKLKKDAAALGAIVDPTDRDVFYLAQSLRDAGELEEALDAFNRHVRMGGPEEYTYNSYFNIAVLMERLQRPYNDVLHAYLRAYSFRDTRAEPLVEGARYARVQGEYETALSLATIARKKEAPAADVFVVDTSCYTWRADDEVAMNLFFLGNEQEAWDVYRELLNSGKLPEAQKPRIVKNMGALIR